MASIAGPGSVSVAYASDGLLPTVQTWSGGLAGSVTASYDNHFRVTSQGVNGTPLAFQYDNDGLLTSTGSLTMQRDSATGLVTGSSLGSITDTVSYDAFGAPASYTASAGSNALYSAQYTRDNAANVTQKVETISGANDTYVYAYDPRGRLVQVQKDGTTVSTYTYDANSNRLSFTGQSGSANGTYDAQDRMTAYGATTYTYSANGELRSATTNGQTTSYTYDVFGNLLGVARPDGTQIGYVIDGQNRRVGKRVNGTLVQGFIYQDQRLSVAQLDGSGNVVSRFVYGPQSNVPDYLVQGGSTQRIIADSLGSPRLVVNSSTGQVAEQLNYDEFGNVTLDTNPGFQPFGFAGGLYDHDTGLVRFGRRDYDSMTGRWTTKDPLGFGGSDSNLYAYAHEDPINLVDPDGMAVNCVRKGNQIDLTLRITYKGLEATDQNIQLFNNQIMAAWTGQWGKYSVTLTVENGPDNTINLDPNSTVVNPNVQAGGNTGTWAPQNWVAAAHEAGHLMGLPDRYVVYADLR